MSLIAALKQHVPEWPGFRPGEWFRKRREAASGDERVPIRDWIDAGRPARVMGVDSALIWVTAALLAFGLVMVYSASVALPDSPRFALYSSTHFLGRQAMFIVIGAVQGASCFGPAYEFLFILETELRRRKLRDRVPMTFVTSEPYIGHLGLDGVGDTKGLLESELREKHIKWITNARVDRIESGRMLVEELADDGTVHKAHDLPFSYSMMLPAFRGVAAVRGIDKLTNPRGFVLVDKHQRNPAFPNIFAVGVCVAIPPMGGTPVPVGVPKTGFMIESMVTATAINIGALLRGQPVTAQPTWNAICLADFGDTGVAFLAQPQIPPRNVNWSSKGEWVHYAKVAFEKYFLRKMRRGTPEPFYERFLLDRLDIAKIKEVRTGT